MSSKVKEWQKEGGESEIKKGALVIKKGSTLGKGVGVLKEGGCDPLTNYDLLTFLKVMYGPLCFYI